VARPLVIIFTLLAALMSSHAFSYRFVCNGYDANGRILSDQCGVCDENNAARWNPPAITVQTDLSVLPVSLSAKQWISILEDSLKTWNNVPGSGLQMTLAPNSYSRSYGTEITNHSIFWITDAQEWRKKVGGGELNTLGITLAPYWCPDQDRPSREMFDADIALNGTGAFNWQASCPKNSSACSSVKNTLIHELGHVAGLGHPPLNGDQSIMCAIAGSNLEYLKADDHAGILALYPAQNGHFGSHCKTNTDCVTNLVCTTQEKQNYCSSLCDSNAECPMPFICNSLAEPKTCVVGQKSALIPAASGESCRDKACAQGLVCAGSENSYFCFSLCSSDEKCEQDNQICKALPGTPGACVTVVGVAEKCGQATLCSEGNLCVKTTPTGPASCRTMCDPLAKQCIAGEYCVPFLDSGICLPQGINLEPELASAEMPTAPFGLAKIKNSGCNCSSNSHAGSSLQLTIFGALWFIYIRVHTQKMNFEFARSLWHRLKAALNWPQPD